MSSPIEYQQLAEIDVGEEANAVTFTANGEHLVSGGWKGVQVWHVKDGTHIQTIPLNWGAQHVATSKDGRWIAAGTINGDVFVWDSAYRRIFADNIGSNAVWDLDFSPNSSRLVSASYDRNTATIWDIVSRKKVRTLDHSDRVYAAKYSPQGDRIATISSQSVHVWDSNNGRLVVDIKVSVEWQCSLLWSNNNLFVATKNSTVKQINAATGSTVADWPVPYTDSWSHIALPKRTGLIAYAGEKAITFWNTATRSQHSFIQHTHNIRSIACSSDGEHLAIVAEKKIIVKNLSSVILTKPELHIPSAALDPWKDGQLRSAEASLSAAIPASKKWAHHLLASRALVHARLEHFDAALVDAEKSLEIQPSVIGYIAMCVARVRNGEMDAGCRVCDIAFLCFSSEHVSLLLLIKAVVLCMAGEHVDAISRIDDLIANGGADPSLYGVRAYMYLLLGNKHIRSGDYELAIQSFKVAQTKLGSYTGEPPLIVSLISGWCFDNLAIQIQQHRCEALLGAGSAKEASECVLRMDKEIKMPKHMKTWVSDFKHRCRRKLEDLGDNAANAQQHDDSISHYTLALSLDPTNSRDLLKRSNAWMSKGSWEDALNDAKTWTESILTSGSWKDALAAAVGFTLDKFTIHRTICDHLETTGWVANAVACFHQMSSELAQETDEERADWFRDFKSRCYGKLENLGDDAINAKQYDRAVSQYTAALSLNPATPQNLLVKRSNAWVGKGAREDALNDVKAWAESTLASHSWKDALTAGAGLRLEKCKIYHVLCEHLEMTGHVTDAVACFHQMSRKLAREMDGESVDWIHDFKSRCRDKLDDLGNSAANARQYDEAISRYTEVLSLDPSSPQDLRVKRSKVYADNGEWKDALNDANEVIKLDPSSPSGYERKYAAQLGMGHDDDAIAAFETMLLKMSESSDPVIRERSCHYVRPERTKEVIHASIERALCDSPLVLIDTSSGRLCNKSEQTAAFESTPTFARLVASTTTHINYTLIEQEVAKFYRYATLSHTWEGNEPLYEKVTRVVVYKLEAFPTHEKLRMFCKIVQEEGYNWAWSDTCCIDKSDHFVLQEALVSMFKWYEGSAMTIIFLYDVDQLSEIGALMESRWNSRAWTFQEYHASKVVRIYTKDWKPYLGLTIHNHKESPKIISEMEKATGISAQSLVALRPGLKDIREKLRLASTRQTTRVEDAAYSLLGIFSMTLPVTYGEGDKALGRLLSQLLMSSGDRSILAWNGKSNSFNSCLPAKIVVYSQPVTSHIPPPIPDAEMVTITSRLRASALNPDLITGLYDRVDELPTPNFAGQRMRLPCLAFKIRTVSPPFLNGTEGVFRAQVFALGAVRITSRLNLTKLNSLYLVHPWINFLLDRHATGHMADIAPDEDQLSEPDDFPLLDPFPDLSDTDSHADTVEDAEQPPTPTAQLTDAHMEFLARLRQPFGALLLAPTRRNAAEYKRIATEGVITAQVQEMTAATLNRVMQGVRVLDVL